MSGWVVGNMRMSRVGLVGWQNQKSTSEGSVLACAAQIQAQGVCG